MTTITRAEAARTAYLKLPKMDGVEIREGIFLMGEPLVHADGSLRCLANVHGALCVVELSIRLLPA